MSSKSSASTPVPQANQAAQLAARTAIERRINLAVQRNGNQTVLFTNAIAQHIGLSATEMECFSLLMDEGPFTAGQLGAKCGLSSGGVTGLVNRLVKAGFVTREQDSADRRRVVISARKNPEVIRKLTALYAPVAAAFDDVMRQYTPEQLQIVADFLDRTNAMTAGLMAGLQAARQD